MMPLIHRSLINILKALLLLILIIQFVPFSPKMPALGLDASWALGLNQAIAQGFIFGKDIIFTLGPYSSIYTQSYHPATDGMMLWGSLYLALSYWVCLLYITTKRKWIWLIVWGSFIACLLYAKDTLLLSYPLLAGLAATKMIQTRCSPLLTALVFAPLGLLLLIKGSLLLLTLCILSLVWIYLWFNQEKLKAWVSLISPLTVLVIGWLIAGQPLNYLADYLINSMAIASDFTEPMAFEGDNVEIIVYLITASALLFALKPSIKDLKPLHVVSVFISGFSFTLFFLFLFLSFKAGFTRHYGHSFIASSSLLLATLTLALIVESKKIIPLCVLALGSCVYIDSLHTNIRMGYNIVSSYKSAWHGFNNRLFNTDWLQQNYVLSLDFLKNQNNLPLLKGKTDIYSYHQSALIASGNQWAPRPVFQSYSVFSARLAAKNKNYLLSKEAPESIIFHIEPIDERLPSLEDGASWPVLLAHYKPAQISQNALILQKRADRINTPCQRLTSENHRIGERVLLTTTSSLLFATIDLKPTPWGRFATLLYKTKPLRIKIVRQDGTEKVFRFSANMAQSPFLLSPLVETIDEFAALYQKPTKAKQVIAFSIELADLNSWDWQNTYELRLSQKEILCPDVMI